MHPTPRRLSSVSIDAEEWRARIDLAAAFRLAAEFGWHESVGNHFSAALTPDGTKFLLNPKWSHFSLIRASDLMVVDACDDSTMSRPDAPDPSAWAIHGSLHTALPRARCILHLHPPYATALAALDDPEIKPIDQNTARYFGRLAIDREFGGLAEDRHEGARLARVLGERTAMIMANHGVLVACASIAEAFDEMYYLERACRTMILAYSTGQRLKLLQDDIARKTAAGWEDYRGMGPAHFDQLKVLLDRKDGTYAE